MRKKVKALLVALPIVAFVAVAAWYLHRISIPVLEPAGPIAHKERGLMFVGLLLAVLVVVPVYAMTILFVWKYRASNMKAKYRPDWNHSRVLETLWWGIPIAIITILSVIAWNSAHSLDPFRPLSSTVQPLTVQVVAMDWKWLFIYPGQNVASVNLLEMPENTPINFQITSDSVMNSFWIPQLGGQIYAMPGMDTQLHLMASRTGDFYGSPANIAGAGFADMTFTARSVTQSQFSEWLASVHKSPNILTLGAYNQLAQPSENNVPIMYADAQAGLYNQIVMKYMEPSVAQSGGMPPMSMGAM